MKRRQFLALTGATVAAAVVGANISRAAPYLGAAGAGAAHPTDAAAFRAARRFADLPFGKIAYVERGSGDAALFLHGAPLNGFQWRGALDRLSPFRRCVAPDFMGLGYSEVPEQQSLRADAQVAMLAALLDTLAISRVDIVASDSGGAVAQLFAVRYPGRVRTMLLTNCDVEPDSPPPKVKPAIEMARAGTLADATAKWLTDKALARSTFGAAVYRDPSRFADETIEYYVTPLVSSPLRRAQYHAFHIALEPNPLAGIEASLKRSTVPVRIVWGASDDIFSQADADYLDHTFPRSQGIRRVPGAKLFFQEEFPDIIAEEAKRLWRIG
ncbi:pimeloyl-ACP methyl ester carboxylesterase [Luteibacter rhizovicinus]|uniref:Pimeloyl-ACP methyl ester carboxylesterase n=1 Tax=Luteibacter rhizovicinus TaxID=242606 RepID=A0A4R3YV70_9GAMM|nr:alpha/beta hydrolase [Luteibacter rhizovicinus]TCV96392.1 pimeloyl-ACP methyl ester carboxylesterase [Luteibacter rhizovicinus]